MRFFLLFFRAFYIFYLLFQFHSIVKFLITCNFYFSLIFSEQFKMTVTLYKKIFYNKDILRQTACTVVNLIMVDNFASLFTCTTVSRSSD